MSERSLYRVGAWAAVLGALIALVANVLHPRPSDFDQPVQAELRMVAASDGWIAIHLALLVGTLLIVLGLFAFIRSLKEGPADGWARLALGGLVISGPVAVATLLVDGYATKEVAGLAQDTAGVAVATIGWALFMGLVLTFIGITPFLIGVAVAIDGRYPTALGWGAAILGAVAAVDALVGFAWGQSAAFWWIFNVTSGLLTLWVLALGVLLGRRARSPVAA